MRRVLAADVLGAEKAVDFELSSLADELEIAGDVLPIEAVGQTLRIAREWLTALAITESSFYNFRLADADAGMVLETLSAKISLQSETGEHFLCSIEELLLHVHGAELQRWSQVVASLLRELEVIAAHVRFNEQPQALQIRELLGARTAGQPEVLSGLGYRVTCDEKYCWRSCRSSSQATADLEASKQGWLVSEEKDLCPEHRAPGATVASPPVDGSGPFDGAVLWAPPGSLPTLAELPVLDVVRSIQKAFDDGVTLQALLVSLQDQFGEEALLAVARELPPTDEVIFEFLRTHTVFANETAFSELLTLVRALAAESLPVPPAPPVPPETT